MVDGFDVIVEGVPKAQPRPRACARGKFVTMYDPGTARLWKATVKNGIRAVWNGQPYGGPLHVTIGFLMPRPKWHLTPKGKLKLTAPYHHTGKPDVDNLAKAALDAMTDLGVWRDDSQVSHLEVLKVYSLTPGARIILRLAAETDHIRS